MDLAIYRRLLAGETFTFVLKPRALWRLNGLDAARYLNGQVTCDVAKLTEGRAAYAAVCNAKGRMEGDVHIAFHDSEFYLDADDSQRDTLGPRLEKYLIADDAVLTDSSDLWSLSHIFGSKPPEPATGFVVANARYGIPGHDIWNAGPGAIVEGDSVEADLIETLRIEHGIPLWGAELTTATLPPEAGPELLNAISYTKGCYVGQETIARLKSVGHVNKTLVFLESEGTAFPPVGARLLHDEKESGTVTSAGLSPRLEKGIALAYVARALAVEGTVLTAGDLRLTVATPLHTRTA